MTTPKNPPQEPELASITALAWLFSEQTFARLSQRDKQVMSYLLTLDPYYKPPQVTIH